MKRFTKRAIFLAGDLAFLTLTPLVIENTNDSCRAMALRSVNEINTDQLTKNIAILAARNLPSSSGVDNKMYCTFKWWLVFIDPSAAEESAKDFGRLG